MSEAVYLHINLTARAAKGMPIRSEDICLADPEGHREVMADSLEVVMDVNRLVSVQANILLHGLDLAGLALVDGKERNVRISSYPPDHVSSGAMLRIRDTDTGKNITASKLQFSCKGGETPVFLIEEWIDDAPVMKTRAAGE